MEPGDDAAALEASLIENIARLDPDEMSQYETFARLIKEGRTIPEVLLSGHHAAIERWRLKQSLGRTWQRRPELLARRALSRDEEALLAEFRREQDGQ